MRKLSFFLFVFFILFTALIFSAEKPDVDTTVLFNHGVKISQDIINKRAAAGLMRESAVSINFNLLDRSARGDIENLTLNLFNDTTVDIVVDHAEIRSANSYTLFGKVQGANGYAILTLQNGILAGSLRVSRAHYSIQFLTDEVYLIRDLDDSQFPPCATGPAEVIPPSPDTEQQSTSSESTALTDDGSTFDVMVVYTPAARDAVGGTAAMEAMIQLAIDETNTIYANSLIFPRVRLVHQQEVAYTEINHTSDLYYLRSDSDGYMDGVHALRDLYGADMVSLIFDDPSICGQAFQMKPLSSTFEASAFSVVHWSCATGYYSFAHEMGHNMGCHHAVGDAGLLQGAGLYNYSHGWRWIGNSGNEYRSVMAYAPGTRINHFSNPDVDYDEVATGQPLGLPDEAYNAKDINDVAYTVANWRQQSVFLEVTPADGFASVGGDGSPFSPSEKIYTLKNTDSSPIDWASSASETWITISPTSGTLAAATSVDVTVSLNANADSLPGGQYYAATVTFTDTTNGVPYSSEVELHVWDRYTVPFSDGFESRNLGKWRLNLGGSGDKPLVRVDSTLAGDGQTPHSGSYVAMLGDSSSGDYAESTMDVVMNLSGLDWATLDFWWITSNLETSDTVRLDIYDGSWHTNINDWEYNGTEWQERIFDLATFNLIDGFIVRFRSYMNSAEFSDAAYVDDVFINGGTGEPPTPTPSPTSTPTATATPTATLSPTPTLTPTASPTATPTPAPSLTPTPSPTSMPTPIPTNTPSPTPTATSTPLATITPTLTTTPTQTPTPIPTATFTPLPTATPSPTPEPTAFATPTFTPTPEPTATPSGRDGVVIY